MANYIIMAIGLIAGQLIRRGAKFRISDVRPLNLVILWISLPALVFVEVPPLFREAALSSDLLVAIATPWLNFIAATAFIFALARWRGWSPQVIGALALTAGLGNTAFVGFPVIESLYGDSGLRMAILIDQLGTFLIVATLGLLVASISAGRGLSVSTVVKRIVFFPPFLSFVIAALWGLSPLPTEGVLVDAFKKISMTLIPLALLSVGWQLEFTRTVFKTYSGKIAAGLGFKLFLWPAVVALCLLPLAASATQLYHVTVMEAAMAPMITAAIVAAEFDLESELAQLMVGIGIPLSALTLVVWHFLLHRL